jgi:glycerophosphoryl diester phosphodiesterase
VVHATRPITAAAPPLRTLEHRGSQRRAVEVAVEVAVAVEAGMELIAHRAGNLTGTVASALAVADAIELDVHPFRGRLEVRHAKVIWPFATRWEPWYRIPASEPRPTLEEILAVVPAGTHLWLDLKGFTRGFARRVLAAVGDRYELTLSSRAWWILAAIGDRPDVRVMRSVGNRFQRWLVVRPWVRPAATPHGPRLGNGVVLHERLADADAVARIRRHWSPVVAWALTDLSRVRELGRIGVTGMIADDLALIAAAGPDAPGPGEAAPDGRDQA